MRSLLLLASVCVLANCLPYAPALAQYGNPPGYYPANPPPPPPPPYGGQPGQYPPGPAYSAENCGTPYEPKPCPPMPRVPLQYYPANRR
jgi:hypothetical protein